MPRGTLLTWILSALAFPACGGIGDPVDPNHCRDTYCVGGEATAGFLGYTRPSPLDLVIVLDDSIPSGPYAGRLEEALREMMQNTLPVTYWDGDNLNVALVPAATSPSQPSRMWPDTPYCALPAGSFLHSSRSCDSPNNFQGDVRDAVACAALHMPVSGLAPRPMETIRTLLGPGGPAQASGFRRKNADLFLAIVSIGDDPGSESAETVSATRDLLSTVVEELEYSVLVGVVAPATATGLGAFARSFGGNGATTDIGADSWSALPFLTGPHGFRDWWPECLDWPLADADPTTDGIQPDCVGTEVHLSAAGRTDEILPPCPADGVPPGACWRVSWDANKCPSNEFRFLVDVQPPACLPDYNIRYLLTCATRYL
jgi:hypothetical protein